MVFFNYATMQMAAKIVYYGPGLCGKTTNLHYIYQKTSPQSRGEMVSLETETDRTLFFDLLPIDVGVIGGFKTRLQLYTVPGQVFYNTTRKLVLKGADGIVFVADSQRAMSDANVESLRNLRENLSEIGLQLDEMAVVVQLNKRDLPNILSREEMAQLLDPEGNYELVEASAVNGAGVFETLKMISKLTLRSLRKRMMGDEPAATRLAPIVREKGLSTPERPATQPTRPVATPEPPAPQTPHSIPPPVFPPPPSAIANTASAQPAEPESAVAVDELAEAEEILDVVEETVPVTPPEADDTSPQRAKAPAPPSPEPPPPPAPAAVSEPRIEPAATPQPPRAPQPAPVSAQPAPVAPQPQATAAEDLPEVKHVKVRSNVDVMAELDSLRKRATGAPKKKDTSAMDMLTALGAPRRPKNVNLQTTASIASKSRRVRVTLQFEDEERKVVGTEEALVEMEGPAQELLINLKVDLTG